mmetsp:Transcript_15260/g.36910  ORF Transcript_15260/g.36910 Transcript_15260/m.36910 type:complete len:290 (+) Transcript_15260:659-1528(+)
MQHLVTVRLPHLFHVHVEAREVSGAGIAPVRQRERRVPELARRTHPDLHLGNNLVEPRVEFVGEREHEIMVDLHRRPALELFVLVRTQRDVLRVALAAAVRVETLVVPPILGLVHDPLRQRDEDVVAHISSAPVERHDELDVHAHALSHLNDVAVQRPIVLSRLPLDETPPHVGHHAVDPNVLEALQTPLDTVHVPLVQVQRHHHREPHVVPPVLLERCDALGALLEFLLDFLADLRRLGPLHLRRCLGLLLGVMPGLGGRGNRVDLVQLSLGGDAKNRRLEPLLAGGG